MKVASSVYSFLSRNSYLLPLSVITLTVLMLLLTLLPSNIMVESKLWSYDKLGHFLLFGSWCFFVGLYYQINRSAPVRLWIIFTSGISFGLIIEILQYALPLGRQADPVDFLFDILGCLTAVWILKKFQDVEQSVHHPPTRR